MSAAVAWPDAQELGVVSVLRASDPDSIVSTPVPQLELDFGGVVGDRHHGLTRPSDTRQLRYYPRGTMIRNRRQLTVVAVEELAEIAERLSLPTVEPAWLGANLLVEGAPELSALPPGTRLLLSGGAGLVCEGVNHPCRVPAEVLQARFPWSRAGGRVRQGRVRAPRHRRVGRAARPDRARGGRRRRAAGGAHPAPAPARPAAVGLGRGLLPRRFRPGASPDVGGEGVAAEGEGALVGDDEDVAVG